MIMSQGYSAAAIPAGYPGVAPGGYGHHPHQLPHYHQPHHHYAAATAPSAQEAGAQPKVERPASPSAVSAAASDPFSPSGCGFGAEDEFDVPPLPPAAIEDPQQQPPPPTQPQHYYGAQQAMYPMNSYYGGQPQQQGGYSQYDQYAYAAAGGYGIYGHPHQQQPPHQGGVLPGGPSPGGGSHNTPSPQAHSEDGDHDHVRNNNILKTEAEGGMGGHAGMMRYAQHAAASHHLIARKPKVSKRKKKRDPNEPQKPVSAYALFFRDTQAGIKARNPNAAFGDVSKVVASMWDNLDPDSKAAYKKRTEMAKKEYLKKLAAYRASLISKGGLDMANPYAPYASSYADIAAMKGGYLSSATGGYLHGGQPIPPRPPMQQQQHMAASNHPGYMMQQQHSYNSQVRTIFYSNVPYSSHMNHASFT